MSNGIKLLKIYQAGYCLGPGALAQKNLGWKKARFYARAFLLEHPRKGLLLIDTGYGEAAVKALNQGINRLYSFLLPVVYRPEDSLASQLAKDGIKDLSYLILTHFHPDHVGALPEFTKTRWIYRKEALEVLQKMGRWKQLQNGFLPDLIPPIPAHSLPILDAHFQNRWNDLPACDVFGDASLLLIDLPGHALGQMGVAIQDHLFAADAQWSAEPTPHPLSFWLQQDPKAYRQTFDALQRLKVKTTPTHAIETHA